MLFQACTSGRGKRFAATHAECVFLFAPTKETAQPARQGGFTRRQLLEQLGLGGRCPAIVGTGHQVAAEMQSWMEEGEIDGFDRARTVVPEDFEGLVRLVVPALQERGIHKTACAPGTLRHKLFGAGDRLPERHAAGSPRPGRATA